MIIPGIFKQEQKKLTFLLVRLHHAIYNFPIDPGCNDAWVPHRNCHRDLQPSSILRLCYHILNWRDFLPVKELPTSGRSFKAEHQCVTIEAWRRLWAWKNRPIRERGLVGAEWGGLSGNGRCRRSSDEDSDSVWIWLQTIVVRKVG